MISVFTLSCLVIMHKQTNWVRISLWYIGHDFCCVFVLLMSNNHFILYYVMYLPMFWMTWWRQQMETFSALLAICVGNSPVPGEFHAQRPVTRSFDVFFDVRLNKRLSKQSWGWWFETLSRPLWRHHNDMGQTGLYRSKTSHNKARGLSIFLGIYCGIVVITQALFEANCTLKSSAPFGNQPPTRWYVVAGLSPLTTLMS